MVLQQGSESSAPLAQMDIDGARRDAESLCNLADGSVAVVVKHDAEALTLGELVERPDEISYRLRHLNDLVAIRHGRADGIGEHPPGYAERRRPDPVGRRSDLRLVGERLRERLCHRVTRYVRVAGVAEQGPPEPRAVLLVYALDRPDLVGHGEIMLHKP